MKEIVVSSKPARLGMNAKVFVINVFLKQCKMLIKRL